MRKLKILLSSIMGWDLSAAAVIIVCLTLVHLPTAVHTRRKDYHHRYRSAALLLKSLSTSSSHFCQMDCSSEPANPVCGTDNATYRSKCELQQTACRGGAASQEAGQPPIPVALQYRGVCVEKRCLEERDQALKASNSSGIPIFVPVCHPDGSYVDVQCHYGTGYCWCVNQDGKPVPGSSIRYDRPKCKNRSGSGHPNVDRSGAPRRSNRNRRGKKKNKAARDKACNQADRSVFNSEVMDLMVSEFRKRTKGEPDPGNKGKKEVVDWKFARMDANGDGVLRKREFRHFRRSVKRLARNKVCGSNFWKYCDMNSDGTMTESEWSNCLGLNVNISFRLFMSLSSKEDLQSRRGSDGPSSPRKTTPRGRERSDGKTEAEGEEVTNADEVFDDCWTANRKALESTRLASYDAYVPECQPDGKYQPTQCFKSSGYCWCVNATSGRPIPGTSVHGTRPACSAGAGISHSHADGGLGASAAAFSTSPTVQKRWKKCPRPEKELFLRNLMDFMTHGFSSSSNRTQTLTYLFEGANADLTNEQRVAKWQFMLMDVNRDQMISRRELRPFRLMLKRRRDLKRCGKRLQFHCDIDEDQKISEHEWNSCLGIVSKDSLAALTSVSHHRHLMNRGPVNTRRRGPNPLKTWLKADD